MRQENRRWDRRIRNRCKTAHRGAILTITLGGEDEEELTAEEAEDAEGSRVGRGARRRGFPLLSSSASSASSAVRSLLPLPSGGVSLRGEEDALDHQRDQQQDHERPGEDG